MTPLFPISSVIHLPTKKYNKFSRTIVTILEKWTQQYPIFSCDVKPTWILSGQCWVRGNSHVSENGQPPKFKCVAIIQLANHQFPSKKMAWGYIYIFVVHFQTHPWLTPPWLQLFGLLVRFDGLWELRWISSLGLGPWSGSTCPQNLMGKMMKKTKS